MPNPTMSLPCLLLAALFCTAISCSRIFTDREEPPPPLEPASYELDAAFPNLTFTNPLDLQHPGDGSDRLFVVERDGLIKVFENDVSVSASSVFLDLQSQVISGNERGLLGLAFHPNFESNGYFYVNYTSPNPLRSIISRFEVSGNPVLADSSSEKILLSYNQPFGTHNSGQLRFGPDDYLYISAGDGGSAGDPKNNAQDPSTLLGSILRIDVDGTEDGNNYAIPDTNPFAGNNQGYREEIFAYGLRNPFRFSFDSKTGDLWTGDVGQNNFEEIDIIENGGNYGWNIVEGNECFEASECDRSGLTAPIYVFDHETGEAIIGGFVYRGPTLDGLTNYYIYADYVSGRIWALDTSDLENPDNTLLEDSGFSISSFGVDAENELYITDLDGTIYRLVEAE